MINGVYSYYDDGTGHDRYITVESIPHVIKISNNGVLHPHIDWCRINCQSLWGWYFENGYGYIGFVDPNEKLLFWLSNDWC